MKLIHHHETPDDGYFKLYKVECAISYKQLLEDVNNYVYDCDGFSINSRNNCKIVLPFNQTWSSNSICHFWIYVRNINL